MKPLTTQESLTYDKDHVTYCNRIRKGTVFLAGLFTELMRQFYADPSVLPANVVQWRSDRTCESPDVLYINTAQVFDDEEVDARPAIIIDMGDLQYQRIKGMSGGMSGFKPTTGTRSYTNTVTGNVILAHMAKTKTQAMLYADATHDFLDAFAKILLDDFGFETFELRSIVKPVRRKPESQDWVASVVLAFSFQETTSTRIERPVLKNISIQAAGGLSSKFSV